VNTTYYWEGKLGIFAIPTFLFLVIVYLGLLIAFLRQLYLTIREKFKEKQRFVLIALLTVVLILTFYKPYGLIDFDRIEGNDLLIAEREGAANCLTTLKLKDDFTFREKTGCFGVYENKGKYRLVNDTIFFDNVTLSRHENEYYKFALIRPSKFNKDNNHFDIVLYKSQNDTIGHELWIRKNELYKLKNEKPTR